jgi:7-keto-8-aminopelargonate synthetase-like enzyme
MSGYAPAHLIPLIDRGIRDATAAGIMMQTADDGEYSGRHVDIGGKRLCNFGGCSYLGLEQRTELREGAIAATRKYGTQFSISRAYLQSPLYEKIESALDEVTGGHVLVAPSTTLGHLAALPVLVQPNDAVLIDRYAHASLQAATAMVGPVPVVPLAHGDLDRLEAEIEFHSRSHERVFYLLDGLYSMHGDFAPLARIGELLATYPKLHLYIDDAHSTSWLGRNGRGWALERLGDLSRVVVALSLNKAFSAAGAALVFPTPEARALVRHCGGPMLFSGPIQPPMLGAVLASAELHLRPDFADLQAALARRITLVQELGRELGVSFANDDPSPIFFVRCGAFETLFPLMQALLAHGMFVCPGGFPAVPKNQSGVRFSVSLHNTEDDIRLFMQTLANEMVALGIPMTGEVDERRKPIGGPGRSSRTSSIPPPG